MELTCWRFIPGTSSCPPSYSPSLYSLSRSSVMGCVMLLIHTQRINANNKRDFVTIQVPSQPPAAADSFCVTAGFFACGEKARSHAKNTCEAPQVLRSHVKNQGT